MLSNEKLKVILQPEDLQELGVTEAEISHSNPATRALLVALLEQGKRETGFRPHRSKLLVEVFPSEECGCILFFTSLSTKGELLQEPQAVIFSFPDAQTLTDAAAGVFSRQNHRIYKSSLYRVDDSYRLIVYPLDYADNLSLFSLSEFAQRKGEGEILAAFIEEHGELLIREDAIKVLAQYFG